MSGLWRKPFPMATAKRQIARVAGFFSPTLHRKEGFECFPNRANMMQHTSAIMSFASVHMFAASDVPTP
eukprot:566967-Pyramimonas_sp.AAC.1